MAITPYIRQIGRGKRGARSLTREQACDLMGEPVADARRQPAMQGFVHGTPCLLEVGVKSTIAPFELPTSTDLAQSAAYTWAVLSGAVPTPLSIEQQVRHLVRLSRAAESSSALQQEIAA